MSVLCLDQTASHKHRTAPKNLNIETEETHLLVLMWQRFTSVFIKVDIILHSTALRIERVTPLFFFETSFCIRSLYFICNCELVHQQKYLLHICTEPLKLSNYFDYKILICI